MKTTKLSSKGQVIIPKPLRDSQRWEAGQELLAIATEEGILLKPKQAFAETGLKELAACLSYRGAAKSIEDMDAAIAKEVIERFNDCC